MSGLWHLLHTTVSPYQELLNAAKASKGLYVGLAALVGVIMNVFVAPHEDDLPISLKVLIVVLPRSRRLRPACVVSQPGELDRRDYRSGGRRHDHIR